MQVSKNLDETARNEVWREHCRKEQSQSILPTKYRISNPEKMVLLPEKPNKTIPKFARPDSGDSRRAEQLLQSLSKTKHHHQTPAEAYAAPLTSNMAYGFLPPRFQPNPMFEHKKASCEITDYAEACVRQGVKPYLGGTAKTTAAQKS